jgi:Pyruvate/2-oxoacid:ferredoxin oxidoreductase delta subunit
VAEIICIKDKLQREKNKKAGRVKKRKLLAVQKIFQCAQCAFKCARCGAQLDPEHDKLESHQQDIIIPYRFCKSCAEEYIDFIKRLQGDGNPECYWHSESWIELWKKWIEYQNAYDRYLKSKEFMQLVDELKQIGPDS